MIFREFKAAAMDVYNSASLKGFFIAPYDKVVSVLYMCMWESVYIHVSMPRLYVV